MARLNTNYPTVATATSEPERRIELLTYSLRMNQPSTAVLTGQNRTITRDRSANNELLYSTLSEQGFDAGCLFTGRSFGLVVATGVA